MNLLQYYVRNELQLDQQIVLMRRFLQLDPHTAQSLVASSSTITSTVAAAHLYINGLVAAKKAVWIYEKKTVYSFMNQLGYTVPPPPLNTQFRLI